jgi:hypothetical protein
VSPRFGAWTIVQRRVFAPHASGRAVHLSYQVHAIHDEADPRRDRWGARVPAGPNKFQTQAQADAEVSRLLQVVTNCPYGRWDL